MKALVIVLMAISVSSWAMPRKGEFSGGGTWKEPKGTTGKWTETVSVKTGADGAIVLHSVLNVYEKDAVVHTEETETTLVSTGKDFFEMKSAGVKVGQGYCYGHVCHMDFTTDKEQGEETALLSERSIRKMGSVKGTSPQGDWTVAYAGELKRAEDKEEAQQQQQQQQH